MKDIILLHGALGTKSLFDPLVKALEDEFKVHRFNFSGHGLAPFDPAGFGIEIFARELAAFINEHKLDSCPVFGYSMGGYVALHLEATQPGNFTQIVTLGTKLDWQPESASHEASRLKPDIIAQKVPAFANMLAQRHGDAWKELVEATAQMMIGLGNCPLLNAESAKSINIPVTIMLGDQDNMVTEQESKTFAGALPQGAFRTLPDTPHPIEKVDPSLIASALKG